MEINKYNVGDTIEISEEHANSLLELHNKVVLYDSQIADIQRAIYELKQQQNSLVSSSLQALVIRNGRMREVSALYGVDLSNGNQVWDFASDTNSLKRIR